VTRDGAELLQNERDLTTKNGGTTLASARVLCLDRLSHVWLRISGGLNCCQESRRGVRIGQGEDVNDFNLQTKELGCNY